MADSLLKDNRKDYPSFITPRGTAIFPALNEPDYKFKKETGEWHARIRVEPDAPGLDELRDYAQRLMEEAFEAKRAALQAAKKGALLKELKMAPNPVKEEVDPETGDPTGKFVLRAALSYHITVKNGPNAGKEFYKKPDFFDKRGKALKVPPKVGGGSEFKLSVKPQPYETDGGKTIGVSFELLGVQILKVVEGGQRTAASHGFGEEEGDDIEEGVENTSGFGDESDGSSDDGDDF